jgi:hypothetical protein
MTTALVNSTTIISNPLDLDFGALDGIFRCGGKGNFFLKAEIKGMSMTLTTMIGRQFKHDLLVSETEGVATLSAFCKETNACKQTLVHVEIQNGKCLSLKWKNAKGQEFVWGQMKADELAVFEKRIAEREAKIANGTLVPKPKKGAKKVIRGFQRRPQSPTRLPRVNNRFNRMMLL